MTQLFPAFVLSPVAVIATGELRASPILWAAAGPDWPPGRELSLSLSLSLLFILFKQYRE